jgi:hypothetical protein
MADDKPTAANQWPERCIPEAFPDGVLLSDTLRMRLSAFLREASQRPLKPTELAEVASDLVQICLVTKGAAGNEVK